jgi:hypothetical protein
MIKKLSIETLINLEREGYIYLFKEGEYRSLDINNDTLYKIKEVLG